MGLRMINKITTVIDEEMTAIGASRLQMPQLLSAALWHKTGRVRAMGSELYRFKDRRGSEMILAPTHEEEVTKLIAAEVDSAKALPVRVYQIARKFRDEPRPRAGLLRTKEFLMKDLYSFDMDLASARTAYADVRAAYARIFHRLFDWSHLPSTPHATPAWREAEADTGAMGGVFSHEFHVDDPMGEDTLLSCDTCTYTANTECADSYPAVDRVTSNADVDVALYASSRDPTLLHAAVYPRGATLNPVALACEGWVPLPKGFAPARLSIVRDESVAMDEASLRACAQRAVAASSLEGVTLETNEPSRATSLRTSEAGDVCGACRQGHMVEHRAVEIGHTFLLGSRYTEALGYTIAPGGAAPAGRVPLQMGCYGIGITRILGILAQRAMLAYTHLFPDAGKSKHPRAGLVWPRSVTPMEALVLPATPSNPRQMHAAEQLCHRLIEGVQPQWKEPSVANLSYIQVAAEDIALDDRRQRQLGSSLYDAELIGYPLVLLLGKHWEKTGEVEVRQAGFPTRYATFHGVA